MSNINKQATELLIANGQLVADTLRHLANNEIDSDYFAITSTSENGTETEHELVITEYARQAAGTVDELVKALEAKDKSIKFLKERLAQLANFNPDWDALEAATDSLREHMEELTTAHARIAELETREVKPVAWMRNANVTSFMSRFTTDESYAVDQWGDDAVALYSLPPSFIPACFTDERNLMHINERGRETSLIWGKHNSEVGDVKLFRTAGIITKVGE